jgi:hypothetical protein
LPRDFIVLITALLPSLGRGVFGLEVTPPAQGITEGVGTNQWTCVEEYGGGHFALINLTHVQSLIQALARLD